MVNSKYALGGLKKKCNKCKEIKYTHRDFHRNNNTYDGRATMCKECKKTYSKYHHLHTKDLKDED